jgi:hypothetical protein
MALPLAGLFYFCTSSCAKQQQQLPLEKSIGL